MGWTGVGPWEDIPGGGNGLRWGLHYSPPTPVCRVFTGAQRATQMATVPLSSGFCLCSCCFCFNLAAARTQSSVISSGSPRGSSIEQCGLCWRFHRERRACITQTSMDNSKKEKIIGRFCSPLWDYLALSFPFHWGEQSSLLTLPTLS